MTQDEIVEECKKCKESPYYFATKYLQVKNNLGVNVKFSTVLSEIAFNKMFDKYEKIKK